MTARVTTLKGPDAGAYYVEALPSYYLDSDEPAGRWHGRGARRLGLVGEVVDAEFLRVMAGLDPHARVGVHLGRAYNDESVRGFDVTASAPKSVSTLFALGDRATRAQVLAAHDTAVGVMVDWIEAHAHTRYRIDGQVAVVDAEGIIAAAFRQHTSRALDPQLHTHVVIANRVMSPDGRWLALDARSLKLDQRTMSGIYHLALRSELTRRLGVAWQPVVNGIAEMAHMPDGVLEEFSTRTAGVQRRIDDKVDRFIDTFDRDPTPRERWRLEREAVLDSRPPKPHPEAPYMLHARWADRVRALGIEPTGVVDDAAQWVRPHRLSRAGEQRAIEQAVEVLSAKQSTWRPAELTREIAAALPTEISIDAVSVGELLERLTREAVEAHCVDISRPVPAGAVLRRDGRPVSESIADRALTTPAIMVQEERLLAWAERRMACDGIDSATAASRSRVALTVPQAETAAAVAGDADLVMVVGPAGTGKTTALAPAVAQLRAQDRVVFGVAPSAAAAEVLGAETGLAADTIDKLLFEHSLDRAPGRRFDLPVGAMVIVDEAAMVSTANLDRLARLADDRGWRVALVGDPMQFSAVGRGGMFGHLIDTHGAIELDQVHRFRNDWERDASLRLRSGDPSVAEVYDRHGRIHGGTATRTQQSALDAWETARARGESVVLAAPTNETVTRLNHAAQQRRLAGSQLDTAGRTVVASGYRLHVGDEVATRRNHRLLRTDRGHMVANRDQWTIDVIHRNGDLTVHGRSGAVRLPGEYVQAHVELAYAQTSHATQGRTVDRSILVLDGPCDVRGLYVPMTRGRDHNDVYIATTGEQTAVKVFAESITRSWIDTPASARQAELAEQHPLHRGTLPARELQRLLGEQAGLAEALGRLRQDLEELPDTLASANEQLENMRGHFEERRDRLQKAFDTIETFDRPLRRRGHESEIAAAKNAIRDLPEPVATYAGHVRTIQSGISEIERRLTDARRRDQRRPTLQARLDDITGRLDDDRRIRTRQLRRVTPDRITETIGARPARGDRARAWDVAAGRLDQHQRAYGLTKGLGPARGTGLPAGYLHSRTLAEAAERDYMQAITLQRRPGIEREGPFMGIGR